MSYEYFTKEVKNELLDREEPSADIASFRLYMRSISRFQSLTPEELYRLGAILLCEPDEEGILPTTEQIKDAKNTLINTHLKFVVSRARLLKRPDCDEVELMDLITAGNDALMEAVEKWDYHKGRLTTFSQLYIDGAIIKLLPKELPETEEEAQEILDKLPDDEARKRRKAQWKKEKERRDIGSYALRLDKEVDSEDSDSITYGDFIAGACKTPEQLLVQKEASKTSPDIFQLLHTLEFQDIKTQYVLNALLKGVEKTNNNKETILKSIMKGWNMSQTELLNHISMIRDQLERKGYCFDYEQQALCNIEAPTSEITEKETEVVSVSDNTISKEQLGALYALLDLISSGETILLEAKQKSYGNLFDFTEGVSTPSPARLWKYRRGLIIRHQNTKRFIQEVSKLKSVPCHQYVIRFLLQEYQLGIGEPNERALWKFLDDDWGLAIQASELPEGNLCDIEFTERDCNILMKYLCNRVEADFRQNNISLPATRWTTHFQNNIVKDLKSAQLNELALVYHMEQDVFLTFRKKVLMLREKDFLDRDFLYTFLVLKYADSCGMHDWTAAYDKLVEFYSSDGTKEQSSSEEKSSYTSTIALSEDFSTYTEQYRNLLFTEKIDELDMLFKASHILEETHITRTHKKEMEAQWEKLIEYVTAYDHDAVNNLVMNQKNQKDKNYKIDGAKVQLFLYGGSPKQGQWKRFRDKKERQATHKDQSVHFFYSRAFDNTFIDANRLEQFGSLGNAARRNMLLTVIFLNFTYELRNPVYQNCSYEERLAKFQYKVAQSFVNCGFMLLHSSNAYDAFLKLLLTCSNPLDLFRDIWHKKVADLEKEVKLNGRTN